ncbi:ribbon-helix-helix protein, CopG family, partial [Acinetobacter baumannii]
LYILRTTTEDEMTAKRTMTLNLTDAEMRVLDELSARKDITKTAVLRQALRLYQTIDARVEKGEKLLFENDATKEKAELMLL